MDGSPVLLMDGHAVATVLTDAELEIADIVRRAYEAHDSERDSLPHSTFLTFPGRPRDRIIALPAYLDGEQQAVGVKWISSFPGNLDRSLERASAVILLNEMSTGRVNAIVEGSLISARRTGASAALAARRLHGREAPGVVGVVGCGRINHEVLRFLVKLEQPVASVLVHDVDPSRARSFADRAVDLTPGRSVGVCEDIGELIAACDLLSFATTAQSPHVHDLARCRPGTTILHVSLRDIGVDAILGTDNVVDDADHVCRAGTSLHLAEQAVGHRRFIRCSLGEVLLGRQPARRSAESVVVFSPFGLGTLDIALAAFVADRGRREGLGRVLADFWPGPGP